MNKNHPFYPKKEISVKHWLMDMAYFRNELVFFNNDLFRKILFIREAGSQTELLALIGEARELLAELNLITELTGACVKEHDMKVIFGMQEGAAGKLNAQADSFRSRYLSFRTRLLDYAPMPVHPG